MVKTWKADFLESTYTVDFDISESPYRGLLPSVMQCRYLPFYSTIDDPVVNDISAQLSEQLEGRSRKTRIEAVLKLIQANVRYVSDESRFGRDMWELPAYTLEYGMADCDGTASLCTSILHCMGEDVVSVIVTGHMCTAAYMPGATGTSYMFKGRRYHHLETTAKLPVSGRFLGDRTMLYAAEPEDPTEEFKRTLVRSC